MQEFIDAKTFLGKRIRIEIDRPLGSSHPKIPELVYEVNYGYVPGIKAPDGDELDAYLLGIDMPVNEYTGVCIAIIHRLNDDDDKLIIVPEGKSYSDEDIRRLTHFQEQWFKSEIVR
jgi:inorganic pyrophosphatase